MRGEGRVQVPTELRHHWEAVNLLGMLGARQFQQAKFRNAGEMFGVRGDKYVDAVTANSQA